MRKDDHSNCSGTANFAGKYEALVQFQLAFLLAPWLQPLEAVFLRNWKPFKQFPSLLSGNWSPAKAAVLMRAKLIQTASVPFSGSGSASYRKPGATATGYAPVCVHLSFESLFTVQFSRFNQYHIAPGSDSYGRCQQRMATVILTTFIVAVRPESFSIFEHSVVIPSSRE